MVFFVRIDIIPVEMSFIVNNVPVDRFQPLRASWQNSVEGPQWVSWSTRRSHKDRVGTRLGHPVSVGSVAVVVLCVVTAEDVGYVTGRWDTNRGLRRWCALAIWSSLQEWNNLCILLILCNSVSLLFEEVGGDAARYRAHESGESSAELEVS